MDLDYLHRRQQEEAERGENSESESARRAHAALATACCGRIPSIVVGKERAAG